MKKDSLVIDDVIARRDELAAALPALRESFESFQRQFSKYVELTKQFESKAEADVRVRSRCSIPTK